MIDNQTTCVCAGWGLVAKYFADGRRVLLNHGFTGMKSIPSRKLSGRPAWFLSLLGLLLLAIAPAFADTDGGASTADAEYVVTSWTVQDGLPSARINDLVQTRDGYIWLATYNGLVRFDGVRFEKFYETDAFGPASRLISCLLEDSKGLLWYGTETGQIGWFDENGFHVLKTQDSDFDRRVESLVETADGTVWAITRRTLLPIVDQVAQPAIVKGAGDKNFWAVSPGMEGALWVLRDGGSVSLVTRNDKAPQVAISGEPGIWRNILGAQNGGVWIRDGQRIRRWQDEDWNEDLGTLTELPVANNVILSETRSGLLLVGSYGQGLFLVKSAGEYRNLNHASGLSHDQVLCCKEDEEGNIWVGTVHGLNRITPRVVRMIAPPDNWQNRAVTTVSPAAKGGVWAGTEGAGIYRVTETGKVLWHQSGNVWRRDFIRCLVEDAGGRVWTGLFGWGLRARDDAHRIGYNIAPLTVGAVNTLFRDSKDQIWVGSALGVARYAKDGLEPSETLLQNSDVRCLAESLDGSIWMGLQGEGLVHYHDGKIENPGPAPNMHLNVVHALHVSPDGSLWVGTWGNGLGRLKDGKWLILSEAQGLPADSISDIRSEEDGSLWVGSSRGLFRIGKGEIDRFASGASKSVNCLQLGSSDGLSSLEIPGGQQPIACQTSDGLFWYATGAGLVILNPKAIKPNTVEPPVVIETLVADGEPLLSSSSAVRVSPKPGPNSVVECPPATRQLEVHYTALSLSAPEQVRFRYRLQGLDDNWTEAGDRRIAYFPHVPPGNYTFQVIACNNHGLWNNVGASVGFKVLPTFWQTIWFKLLVGAAFVAALTVAHRVRTARLRALERLRHRIARDLHDEVGANLGSISLLAEVMEKTPQPGDIEQIRNTADQTVDTLRDIVWIIDPSHERLSDLVARLKQTATTQLVGISHKVEERGRFHDSELSLDLRRNVPPLFKEILHNIVKHARAQHVGIRLETRDGDFVVEVKDDGIGFDTRKNRSGNGLKNFKKRAEDMGGAVMVNSQLGQGTTVILTVPLTRSRGWWQAQD